MVISGGVSLLSNLFGSHSGKTTHAQRFFAAQASGDTVTAHLLIDQAYNHAYIESIPDKGDWVQVWQVMLNGADTGNRNYMLAKTGVAPGGGTGSGALPASPLAAGIPGGTLGLLLIAGVALMALRGRR